MAHFLVLLCLALFSCFSRLPAEESKGVVVITGVTKGLGLALAQQFAKDGWTVAGCGRSFSNLESLRKSFGKNHLFSAVDITKDPAVAQWAKEVFDKLGPPDILINNAGVLNQPAPLWAIPAAEIDRIFATNVMGTFNSLRHFVPTMIQRGKGTIINMSSSSGREGDALYSPYVASKFAVEGLTKCLAVELPKGMVAVSLDPGTIQTDMLRNAIGDEANEYPIPDQWIKRAFPFIMQIGLKDNGKELTVPQVDGFIQGK